MIHRVSRCVLGRIGILLVLLSGCSLLEERSPWSIERPFYLYNRIHRGLYAIDLVGPRYVGVRQLDTRPTPVLASSGKAQEIYVPHPTPPKEPTYKAVQTALFTYDMSTGMVVCRDTLVAPYFGRTNVAPTARSDVVYMLANKLPPSARSFSELSSPKPWYVVGFDPREGRIRHAVGVAAYVELVAVGFMAASPSGRWIAVKADPGSRRGDSLSVRKVPYLAVLDVEQDTVRHEVLLDRRGKFSRPVFAPDGSALYVYEYATRHVYRLALPSMEFEPVCTVPELRPEVDQSGPKADQIGGLVPASGGEVLLHYNTTQWRRVFVTLGETGTPEDGETLEVAAHDYAYVDDQTLLGIGPAAPPEQDTASNFSDSPQVSRSVPSETEEVELVYINTATWKVERKEKIEMPKNAHGSAQLISPHQRAGGAHFFGDVSIEIE